MAKNQQEPVIRVLLVEDDECDDLLIKEALYRARHGSYEVTSCESAGEATELLDAHVFDVIILDMGVPDAPGLQIIELCRPLAGAAPIIAISSDDDDEFALEAIRCGAQSYLYKGDISSRVLMRVMRYGVERKRMLEEMKRAAREAEAATRAKSIFLANMSHEIRTPLTAILGYADLVHKGLADRPDLQKNIDIIRTSGCYLLDLINDILDLSKIEAGRLDIERIECSPAHVISSVVSAMKIVAADKGLLLKVNYRTGIPHFVNTDPTRLRQALVNLVGNAVKFTERGKVTIDAGVVHRTDESSLLEISVTDTGIGISKQKIQNIFDPFCQADNSTTREYGGTGLGLTITKQIAEALGGSLTAESEEGQYTRFTITVDAGDIDVSEPFLTCPQEEEFDQEELPDMEIALGGKVLLVEDIDVNRRLIKIVLERFGLEVETAENGQVALDMVEQGQYDLILMDLQMPVMDGLTATRELRQRGYETPIVAISANVMHGANEKCLEAGCDGYLAKPIDTKKIAVELSKFLRADIDVQLEPDADGSTGDIDHVLPWFEAQEKKFDTLIGRQELEETAATAQAIAGSAANKDISSVARELERVSRMLLGEHIQGMLDTLHDQLETLVLDTKHITMDTTDSSSSTSGPINTELALERMQLDWETFLEILGDSIEYLNKQRPKLEAAIKAGDLEAVSDLAHALASNAGNVGMESLLNTARKLEHIADGQVEGDVDQAFATMVEAFDEAMAHGQTLLQQPVD